MLNHAEVGRNVKVVVNEQLPARVLDAADALVIVRPYPSTGVAAALDRCEARGVLRVADYDDLLFAGPAEERPEVASGRLSLAWARSAQSAYASILDRFDGFTVSTAALADELRAVRPSARVAVVPNGLSPSWVAQGRRIYRAWTAGDARVMRFFPGSPTHDESFAAVVPALARALSEHRDLALEVVGNLRWDASALPRDRVRHVAAVPFDHLPSLLASAWVSLWPRAESRFNQAKSPIKLFEAAAFGCPTVASSRCRSAEIDADAADGAITYVDGADEWVDAIGRLRDDEARTAAGEASRGYADGERADRGWRALRGFIEGLGEEASA